MAIAASTLADALGATDADPIAAIEASLLAPLPLLVGEDVLVSVDGEEVDADESDESDDVEPGDGAIDCTGAGATTVEA